MIYNNIMIRKELAIRGTSDESDVLLTYLKYGLYSRFDIAEEFIISVKRDQFTLIFI